VGGYLLVTALSYTVGSVFFGTTSERLERAGVSKLTVLKLGLGVSVVMFALLAAGVRTGLGAILAVYGFCTISAALAYSLLTPLFPPAMTGRVNTASNVLMFGCSFAFQWGVGAVLRLYPSADGRYAPEGYAMALGILTALQVAVLAWLLPLREKPGPEN
jgi:uncharacterized membrane protein